MRSFVERNGSNSAPFSKNKREALDVLEAYRIKLQNRLAMIFSESEENPEEDESKLKRLVRNLFYSPFCTDVFSMNTLNSIRNKQRHVKAGQLEVTFSFFNL